MPLPYTVVIAPQNCICLKLLSWLHMTAFALNCRHRFTWLHLPSLRLLMSWFNGNGWWWHKRIMKPFLVADTRLYTLPCRSVGRSVRPSVRHILEFRAVLALQLLPNRPRLSCRVSGLVGEEYQRFSNATQHSLGMKNVGRGSKETQLQNSLKIR